MCRLISVEFLNLIILYLMPNSVFKIKTLAPKVKVVITVLVYIKRIIGSNILLFVIVINTFFNVCEDVMLLLAFVQ